MSGWGSDPWREEHQHPHRRNWLAESGGLTGCCVTTPSRGTASMGACCSGAEVAGILDLGGEGGGGEGCDGYPVCCCVVGIGRGSYRLQACQRLRKECWREKGDGLPFTGKQWAIYSPSDPPSPSPLPPSPSSRPTFPLKEWSNEGANAGTERRRGSSAKLLDWTSGRSHPTQPAFSGRSGTSWLFSHVRRDKVPAFPTGRERGECIGQAASAYHLGAWRASTHTSNVDASSV